MNSTETGERNDRWITVGAGKRNPQGRVRLLPTTVNPVSALAEALRVLPSEVEGWWSGNVWQGAYRTADNWRSASVLAVDIDYCGTTGASGHGRGSRKQSHVSPPPERAKELETAASTGRLPGNIFHATPRGARVIFVFEGIITNNAEMQQVASGACSLLESALADLGLVAKRAGDGVSEYGYSVDPASKDLARMYYTPNATVDGARREASVTVIREQEYSPSALADSPSSREASGGCPRPVSNRQSSVAENGLDDAVRRWNAAHPQSWPKSGGTCPTCDHKECFGQLDGNPDRWACFSASHESDSGACGLAGAGVWHGDSLDIEAHHRGVNRTSVLMADGYWRDKGDRRMSNAGEDQEFSAESIARCLATSGLEDLTKGASSADCVPVLTNLSAALAGKSPVFRALVRETVIRKFKEIGLHSPALLIDSALGKNADSEKGSGLQGSELKFAVADPWPDPVDGQALLRDLTSLIQEAVVMPPGGAEAVALWVVHTYAVDASDITPRLGITSATRGCGKTTLLDLLRLLVRKSVLASNMTTATTFRVIQKFQPTLLVDEADTFLRENSELRGILNAGHGKSGQILRTEGDGFEVRAFSVFSPLAIGIIGKLHPTLEHRSIEIRMKRKRTVDRVTRLRGPTLAVAGEGLRRRVARWVSDNIEALKRSEPTLPPLPGDRAEDNWRPLLAIADAAGGDWPRKARDVAVALEGGKPSEPSETRERLLADIRRIFAELGGQKISSESLVGALAEMEDAPWPEWGRQEKPITPKQLATLLQPFGIKPHTIRLDSETTCKGYELADFKDAFERYPEPPRSVTGDTHLGHNDLGNNGIRNNGNKAWLESLRNVFGDIDVTSVTDVKPQIAHGAGIACNRTLMRLCVECSMEALWSHHRGNAPCSPCPAIRRHSRAVMQ